MTFTRPVVAFVNHVEVVSDEVRLDEGLLLGHGRKVDDLLAHELVVLLRGVDEVGEVCGRGRHGQALRALAGGR